MTIMNPTWIWKNVCISLQTWRHYMTKWLYLKLQTRKTQHFKG
jgi:hypothetical protein